MAYQTGTAQHERDLLNRLHLFLTTDATLVANGQTWEMLAERNIEATATEVARRQIVWQSKNTGNEQTLYVMAETVNSIGADTYNINLYGATFFNPALADAQGLLSGMINPSWGVVIFADARPFFYHFFADGRCFKVVTRVGGVCSTAYAGFILPTVLPTEYPYPLCIAGSAPTKDQKDYQYNPLLVRYSDQRDYCSSIANPLMGNCWLLTPDQSWRDFSGSDFGKYSNDSGKQLLYPAGIKVYQSKENWETLRRMTATPGGTYPLYPIEFMTFADSTQGINRWGMYDGVYWLPGVQRATGDLVTLPNGHKGLVCNNGYRVETTDYFVIDLGA